MMVLGKYWGRYIYHSLLWSCFQWTGVCGPHCGRSIVLCDWQTHNSYKDTLWRLLVDVGHVTRERIVVEATTSI
ncbi:uncharacterized protein F5891DRAFT_1027988 [Suillus fuscotomentosus]|uniref:Uncharacterized protein n=1 Tax=Suillus fuscotomentosus TaxID=1912939 RepID=A0AAD4HNJ6_9AGAM|nr:uncharacterized protein F5891DRAFT_1027988 [Suillus fuscotomentosus]KAG1901784.1 hypothetical protein F5891DRAFT_1027988 [Suillus fuscotomentosus]